jgi:hypothetical protein
LPSCAITYSPDVAVQAARAFFWRKFRTKFGAVYLASFVLIAGFMMVYAQYFGFDWLVGMLGTILAFNVILQLASYFAVPRAMARLASDRARDGADVEATAEWLKVASGQRINTFPWSTFKHVWVYDDFMLLVLGEPLANRFFHVPTAGMSNEIRSEFEAAAARAVG